MWSVGNEERLEVLKGGADKLYREVTGRDKECGVWGIVRNEERIKVKVGAGQGFREK